MTTRKEFLRQAIALAGLSFTGMSFLSREEQEMQVFPAFDLHAHPGNFFMKGTDTYPGDEGVSKTISDMQSGHVSGVFLSMVMDRPLLKRTDTGIVPTGMFSKGEGWKEYKRQLATLSHLFSINSLSPARQVKDLTRAVEKNRTAGFLSCEGGDFLESADQLDEVYADGIRSIQLVHYAPNPLGDLQTHETQHDGLSPLGKEVVRKMNSLGMVIDVAHASYKTVQDVASLTQAPIILSHSILKMEADRPIGARAISPEHAKLIAETGGLIGAWPSGFNKSFEEYVENILRLVDVVGIDHVGIGTDMDSNFKPVLDSYQQIPALASALSSKGLSKEEVSKIMLGNTERVLRSVLKG
ncbi:membrane dipeptidase [Algoriphagus boseongensis]|uniref:Membrane dipeptidase n=1 Tax=Algoriphagus boseongensis TaxID=1442587 RepID=A0A4R6T9X1_9BACT|nr:membrane dipeptidase [Algoriphagus boseongensis]TDQ18224.1 membrane dipeptidase [Algoriphagus boseongensis]